MARKLSKPTKAEKKLIEKRLKAKYPQMYKKGWGKSKSLAKSYAEQTGSPSFAGASGDDLKELQKHFGKKGYKRSK